MSDRTLTSPFGRRAARLSFAPPATVRQGLLRRLAAAHTAWRQRRALERLDARMLRDIGLTEAERRREAERGFWDVPQHWLEPPR